jgi:hypothetical protein
MKLRKCKPFKGSGMKVWGAVPRANPAKPGEICLDLRKKDKMVAL